MGPHDVAIALCGAVYKNGFVKNKVLEFVGDGIGRLSMDYRIGIDVMTTETACLTSIWETDGAVQDYLALHGRAEDYAPLHPEDGAYYDGLIELDLSAIEPMAALPFHPSEAVTLRELIADPGDILREVEKRGRRNRACTRHRRAAAGRTRRFPPAPAPRGRRGDTRKSQNSRCLRRSRPGWQPPRRCCHTGRRHIRR